MISSIVLRFTLITPLLTAVAACGDSAPTPSPGAPDTAIGDAAPPARDFSGIVACEIVPPAEVAAIAGGTVAAEGQWTGPHCMYVVDVASGSEGYVLHIGPVAEQRLALGATSDAERGEPIAGPWQEAYLGPKPFGPGLRIVALSDADGLAVEVSGESRRAPLVDIARRAFERTRERVREPTRTDAR